MSTTWEIANLNVIKNRNISKNIHNFFNINTSCIFSKKFSVDHWIDYWVKFIWLSTMLSTVSFSRIKIFSELIVRSVRIIFCDLRLKICWEFNIQDESAGRKERIFFGRDSSALPPFFAREIRAGTKIETVIR